MIVFAGADELDVFGPCRCFWALDDVRAFLPEVPHVAVHLIAEKRGPVVLGNGTSVQADTSYDDCPELSVLFVPGGTSESAVGGRRQAQTHLPTLRFIQEHGRRTEVVASVCTGSFLLAGAGLLADRTVTTHWTARDELAAFMSERGEPVRVAAERIVDEGPVVTAGGVLSGIDLGLHVVERLIGTQARGAVELALEVTTPGGEMVIVVPDQTGAAQEAS